MIPQRAKNNRSYKETHERAGLARWYGLPSHQILSQKEFGASPAYFDFSSCAFLNFASSFFYSLNYFLLKLVIAESRPLSKTKSAGLIRSPSSKLDLFCFTELRFSLDGGAFTDLVF